MKTILKAFPRRGGLELRDVSVREPDEGEVVVKISTASICGSDQHIYAWNRWAQTLYAGALPMPMGHEFCGTVIEVGKHVKEIKVGDRVCAETHIGCGTCAQCKTGKKHICDKLELFSKTKAGCFAEYTTVTQRCLVKVPDYLSDMEGALLEPFGVAVRAVETAQVVGEDTLIQGCGPLGLMSIQVAAAMGARRIFATDIDPYRLELAKKLGADHVFDPGSGEVPAQVMDLTGGNGVRSICEFTGNIQAMKQGFQYLAKGGLYVFVGLPSQTLEVDVVHDLINREVVMRGCYGREIPHTWDLAFDLLSSGKIDLSKVVTHRFSLEDYAQAFETAESRNCGKIQFVNE